MGHVRKLMRARELWNMWVCCSVHHTLLGNPSAARTPPPASSPPVAHTPWVACFPVLQVKRYKEHAGVVNSVCPARRGPPLLVSASDDCTARLWDMRTKRAVAVINDKFQLTAAAFADAGDAVYTGGLDNTVKVGGRVIEGSFWKRGADACKGRACEMDERAGLEREGRSGVDT